MGADLALGFRDVIPVVVVVVLVVLETVDGCECGFLVDVRE